MRSAALIVLLHFAAGGSLLALDWPDFRGPFNDGRAQPEGDTNIIGLPLRWSETENVVWKTAMHDKGWASPVVLGGQIWLTTADPDGHDFYAICVDQATGKILTDKKIFHCDHPEPLGNDLNGYASPSPVIEPGRVYVHFGSYGTACLDTLNSAVLWKRDDLPCRHYRGPGSSPFLWHHLLILTMDGNDVQYLVALDTADGHTVWKTDRTTAWNDLNADGKPQGGGDLRKGFSTPIVVDNVDGGALMLDIGSRAFYGYDPATGRELWKLPNAGFSPAARALCEHGIAYMSTGNGQAEMVAFHADTPDHAVLWRARRAVPRMSSPVLDHGMLFMVADSGVAACLDCATGRENWRERLGGDYSASVLCGDGRVYFFDRDGKTIVLKASPTFEPLATNTLAAGFMASPAVSGKALYLRTKTDLYRIETK